MQLPSVTFPAALLTYFPHKGRILLNTKSNNPVYCVLDNKLSDCVCVCLLAQSTWREDVRIKANLKDDVAN